jgi:U3 small nucleolar RNA-associated protein 14
MDQIEGFAGLAAKFGAKKLDAKQVDTEIAQDKVLEAARRVSGREKAPEKDKNVQVTFATKDLAKFNTERKVVIKEHTGDQVLSNLFVTHAAEAEGEFEQEKQEDIEHTLGKKVAKTEVRQGWGEWAGSGVDQSGYEARKAKVERARQAKIA